MKYLIIFCGILFIPATQSTVSFLDRSESLPESVRGNRNTMDVHAGDIDNDGDTDLVLAIEYFKNVILINDGQGNFSDGSARLPDKIATEEPVPWKYYPYHDSEDVALGDFDQDNDLDIVVVTEDDQINEYYINDGQGNFTDHSAAFPVTGITNAVIASDFDNDGWIDLFLGNNGQNFYLRNDKGTFKNETEARLPLRNDITQDVEAGDFDNDGDLDVIIGNERKNFLLENDGSGRFSDVTDMFIDTASQVDGETREAEFADINGDGNLDLYFANVTLFQGMPPVQRMLIFDSAKKRFVDETHSRLGFTDKYSAVDADFGDLDNDGDLDLLYQTLEHGARIFINDGSGYFTETTDKLIPGMGGMGVDVELTDFNGDGKADLYFGNFRAGDKYFTAQ